MIDAILANSVLAKIHPNEPPLDIIADKGYNGGWKGIIEELRDTVNVRLTTNFSGEFRLPQSDDDTLPIVTIDFQGLEIMAYPLDERLEFSVLAKDIITPSGIDAMLMFMKTLSDKIDQDTYLVGSGYSTADSEEQIAHFIVKYDSTANTFVLSSTAALS